MGDKKSNGARYAFARVIPLPTCLRNNLYVDEINTEVSSFAGNDSVWRISRQPHFGFKDKFHNVPRGIHTVDFPEQRPPESNGYPK